MISFRVTAQEFSAFWQLHRMTERFWEPEWERDWEVFFEEFCKAHKIPLPDFVQSALNARTKPGKPEEMRFEVVRPAYLVTSGEVVRFKEIP